MIIDAQEAANREACVPTTYLPSLAVSCDVAPGHLHSAGRQTAELASTSPAVATQFWFFADIFFQLNDMGMPL